ncbi:hypothetical protein FNV43_RR00031 [Rhamnella rubrinervis]|uniref:Uncharacterized protein n=1 Tax=Rhamnella rubrinervis TaxID=2594499 RepID=A0A8K0MQU1_9ROSA|nr:hypothetical protein FNV43_RR00031 [Rhamnella rubrinervis]
MHTRSTPSASPQTSNEEDETKFAVVIRANQRIGLEIVEQLASNGIKVVLTSRDENVASLADFIKTQFDKLDILVNNAGVGGTKLDGDVLFSPSNADLEFLDLSLPPSRAPPKLSDFLTVVTSLCQTQCCGPGGTDPLCEPPPLTSLLSFKGN